MVSVPKQWPGATVVCIATGPSLVAEDVDAVRDRARVIAINNAYTLAPWADALYGTDARWWHWHLGVPSFTGPKWSLEHSAWTPHRARYPEVQRLRNTGSSGLEHDPRALRNGRNSGYAAINLAVHYGATRILLLGYDMGTSKGRSHFFGDHPNKQPSPYAAFRNQFQTIVKPLKKIGVEVINCSRRTALVAFPTGDLRETIARVMAA